MKRGIGLFAAVVATVAALSGVASGAGSSTAAIAFVTNTSSGSNPTVWVADARGHNARKLGPGEEPQISPNGQYVAADVFGHNTNEVVVYRTAGGVVGKFVAGGGFEAWSSDSRYLAISVFNVGSFGVAKSELAVVDITTRKTVVIAHGLISGASFEPNSSDTLVFGKYKSQSQVAPPVNLYTADPTGTVAPVQLTHDNNSLNPLWTARGIVYDRQRKRKLAPEYQLYLLSGGHSTQLTSIKVDQLSEGLVPIAASADGSRLAAEYEGQDNSEGWAVNVVTHHAKELATPTNGLEDAGISRDGKTVLVNLGVFAGAPPNRETVATIPFGGDTPKKLLRGYQPSWDQ